MADSELEMNKGRAKEFARDNRLETALGQMNAALSTAGTGPYDKPKYPVIIIVGCPRSGTTPALQWLSATGRFAYPSNLLARFYENPYVGALTQRVLIDFDAGNQIGMQQPEGFSSQLGKTMGGSAPSEFWYFWRRFFKFGELQQMPKETVSASDHAAFLKGLAGIEAVFDRPVVLKGMIMNWHLPFLDTLLDKVVFLNMERESFYTAQSLYHARQKFFGSVNNWYSFKPAEYNFLKDRSPIEQVAGQAVYTRSAVREGLASIANEKQLTLQLEDLCNNTETAYSRLQDKLEEQGYQLEQLDGSQPELKFRREITLSKDLATELEEAIDKFEA